MREKTFDEILDMICNSCNKRFYKGTNYDGLKQEMVRCATKLYIEQMRENGGEKSE